MSHIIGIDVSKATLDCAWLRDPDQDKAKRKLAPICYGVYKNQQPYQP